MHVILKNNPSPYILKIDIIMKITISWFYEHVITKHKLTVEKILLKRL